MSTPSPTICSLHPSATEIVFALGLGDRLAAVTHESDFPPEAARLPTITRSTLDSHEPHSSREIHTHITAALHGGSSIYLLDQELLRRLAPDLMLTQELCDVRRLLRNGPAGRPRVFAMEWLDPPFTAGHWVPELISRAGGRDEMAREGYPSTQIPWRRRSTIPRSLS